VTFTALVTLLPMLFGIVAVDSGPGSSRVRTLVVEDRLIVRVPVSPPPRRLQWIAKEGPKCIPVQGIKGAFLSRSDHVDFLMKAGRRLRAELEADCPALDFYEGFYLNPDDKRLCADRDSIRSRMGGSCLIERFRLLVPKPR
jgi:hypothetical protein